MQTLFHCGRRKGMPHEAGNFVYTPESLVMILRVGSFGAVWNWPLAVSVTRPFLSAGLQPGDSPLGTQQDSVRGRHVTVERHAIVDVTRIGLWIMGTITLLSLLAAVAGPLFLQTRRRKYE